MVCIVLASLPLFLLGLPTVDAVVSMMGLAVCQSHNPILKEHSLVTTHCCRDITTKFTESLYMKCLLPSNKSVAVIVAVI